MGFRLKSEYFNIARKKTIGQINRDITNMKVPDQHLIPDTLSIRSLIKGLVSNGAF